MIFLASSSYNTKHGRLLYGDAWISSVSLMLGSLKFVDNAFGRVLFLYSVSNFVVLSIIGLASGDLGFVVYSLLVVIGYPLLYVASPRRYIHTILIVCLVEETIVYFIGGGLHGVARSLLRDYIRSIPIFLTHAVLWLRYMERYHYEEHEIFVMAGMHGFFWEIIVSGMILDPVLTLLFGGAPFILYGLLVLIPTRPCGRRVMGWAARFVCGLYILLSSSLLD